MKLVVFDTETGGFDASTNSILTLGMVVINDNKLTGEEAEFAIKDAEGITTRGALDVNGIDLDAHMRDALAPTAACDALNSWLTKCGFGEFEPVELCGHNMSFDVPFLRRLWETLGHRRYRTRFSHTLRCTMTLATMMKEAGRLPVSDVRLCAIADYFGVTLATASGARPAERYHSALTDARTTAKVYVRLMDLLRGTPNLQRELL
jgi:DNA polymerase III subunit epsilon